jgi:hypothetical protein
MRVRLNIAAIFIAVGLGALVVTVLHDPAALIPRAPYFHWLFLVFSLAALGLLIVLALGDDPEELQDTVASSGHFIHWRAVGLAFLMSAVASATFIAASALVDYLDRVTR